MKKLLLFIFLSMSLSGCNANMPEPVNFNEIKLPNSPNYFLVCPKEICNNPNLISETYPIKADELYKHVLTVVKNMPRVKIESENLAKRHIQFVQRSFIFRFPDFVDIQIFNIKENQSNIAIYSRSKYGYSDFGVNKKRVMEILEKLKEFAP